MRFYVFRNGSNAANQPGDYGPRLVAEVDAKDEDEATSLAALRLTVYNNQHLWAQCADEFDAAEAKIDEKVKIL